MSERRNQLVFSWTRILIGLIGLGVPTSARSDPIQPRLFWARSFGGPSSDLPNSVAVDAQGACYLIGRYTGAPTPVDLDPTEGMDVRSGTGCFFTKLGSDGSFAWTKTYLEVTGINLRATALDHQGHIFIVGDFRGTVDFDPSGNVDNHTGPTSEDSLFLSRFDVEGNYNWTRTIVSTFPTEMTIDSLGRVFVVGFLRGVADFDPSAGVDQFDSIGVDAIFLTSFDNEGSYRWTRVIHGPTSDNYLIAYGVSTTNTGEIYISGGFKGTVDFDPSGTVDNHQSNGYEDAFVSQYSANGTYLWTRTFGGADYDVVTKIAATTSGDVIVVGQYESDSDFDPTAGVDLHGPGGGFVTRIQGNGNYGWTQTFGIAAFGPFGAFASRVALDEAQNIVVAGRDSDDLLITKLSPTGTEDWSARIHGTVDPYTSVSGLAIAENDNIVLTGLFYGIVDFDPTPSQLLISSNGEQDVFVIKLLAGRGASIPAISTWGIAISMIGLSGIGAILIRRRSSGVD